MDYDNEHKEQKQEYRKQYYQDHKEQRQEQSREYHQIYKNVLHKQVVCASCGKEVSEKHMLRHQKITTLKLMK